jgi:peptidyl-prolyl cis-trans isomerase B (cyclophilin B)
MTTDPTPIRPEATHEVTTPVTQYPAGSFHQTPQYVYPPQRPTSGLAITALVLGILGGAILAVIFGHLALSDIRKTGKEGRGMAVAGLVLGYVETAFWVLIIALFAIGAAASTGYAG